MEDCDTYYMPENTTWISIFTPNFYPLTQILDVNTFFGTHVMKIVCHSLPRQGGVKVRE